MTEHNLAVILLAAGKGTRMKSALPKVLHRIAGLPMLGHVAAAVAPLNPDRLVTVVALGMDAVRAALPQADCAIQKDQLGTGHAVRCGLDALPDFSGTVLVAYGDTPLLTTPTLQRLLADREAYHAAISLAAMQPADPTGYGRLVMREKPYVERIVECKDAMPEEKSIRWVWGGVMAFDAAFLRAALSKLEPSPVTGEYYLTALLEMAHAQSLRSVMTPMPEEESLGVNDRVQLAQAEAVMQTRLRERAMRNGATLINPRSVIFSHDTQLGTDCTIQPDVFFGPNVTVGNNVEIRAFTHIEGATIADNVTIGPFARIRPGSVLGEGAHVGNFVELKNTTLGKGAKANHLSYVGDTMVGEGANIGAGTITCNYDGMNKHKTEIGAGAFIGSNSALVAPVSIGAGATVGAGSVITEDVPDNALAIARGRQVVKPKA